MKKLMRLSLIGATVILLAQACYYDNEEELYPGDSDCNTAGLTYQNAIKALVDTRCAVSGCHVSGTGRVVLTTYQGVKAIVDDGRLAQRAIVDKTMPPTGPLPSCSIRQLEQWIADGAPE
jgi:hypothetical protein